MATDIAEALQSAGAASAKPVTLEAIPEATIDVGGGSQSLDIEGLGVKRRRDDLSVATASTSGLAIEDLFGDLLDEVNFADPVSVDSFRANAATRIDELDSNTLSRVTTGASTFASDLANLAGPLRVTPAAQPVQPAQQQFEQVFGPSRVTTGDDADPQTSDIGLDTTTSTELQDISNLTNPGLAASLFGGALGSFGRGANITDFASGLATQGLGDFNFVGAQNAATALTNADITDPISAANALNAAVAVGQKAAQARDLINQGVTISSLLNRAAKNVGEYIEGIYTAIINPDQAMEAFGRQMEFGTLTPANVTYDLPSGKVAFNFDEKTGKLVTPGFVSRMLGPVGSIFTAAQYGLKAVGYTDMIDQRARGMAAAFNNPGVNLGDGVTGFSGSTPEGDMLAVDFDFSNVPGATYTSLQVDFNALDPDQAISQIGYQDLNQASVVQGFPTYDPDLPDQEAEIEADTKAKVANMAQRLGVPLDRPTKELQVAAGQAPKEAAEAFKGELEQAIVQAYGVSLKDFNEQYLNQVEQFGVVETELEDLQRTERSLSVAKSRAEREALKSFRAAPLSVADYEKQASQAAENAVDSYNSPNPTNTSIEIANRTMARTGFNTVNYARDKTIVDEVTKDINAENRTSGDLDFGYDAAPPSIGPSGVSAPGFEAQGLQAGRTGQVGVTPEFIEALEGISVEEEDPTYDPGIDEPGSPNEADGGGGGGGDGKVICTALKDMGLLNEELWQHDGAYGRTLPLETRQGYWAWGVPTAKFIRKNRWAAKAIKPVVTEVAKEMAHRVGYGRGSKLGAALLYVGLPMCRVINRIKNNGNNTRSVYS